MFHVGRAGERHIHTPFQDSESKVLILKRELQSARAVTFVCDGQVAVLVILLAHHPASAVPVCCYLSPLSPVMCALLYGCRSADFKWVYMGTRFFSAGLPLSSQIVG